MFKKVFTLAITYSLLFALNASAFQLNDSASLNIRLNQIGFYPYGPKIAIVGIDKPGTFEIRNDHNHTVFNEKLKRSAQPNFAGKYTWVANFTAFHQPGIYRLYIPGYGYSYPFTISRLVHHKVADASIKAYYFIRASTALPEKYAGKWHRAEGHPDTNVLIHPSAADNKRPAGTIISSPGGWYDAGDYNKYIVNSGISTYTLLSLYEDFPEKMKTVGLNIPESGNNVPDILNEVLWNLRWMLTMQDPNDGGVYHKLTNAAFDKFEMPDKANEPRYVVQKSTAATLDFAAVTAQASRIFKKFPKQLPGLADSCLKASLRAWDWAGKNPDKIYNQSVISNPKISTGDYGDRNLSDEFIWAACELLVTTKNTEYVSHINILPDDKMPLPSWGQVRLLGYYSILRNSASINNAGFNQIGEIKKRMLAFADDLVKDADKTAYQSAMYKTPKNFNWGSNSNAANQGFALIQAYKLSPKKIYLTEALNSLDYILGRNGSGYCYVTGYGSKSTMHPHHRPSVADGIFDPVPGLVAGGANPGMQDHIKVPSTVPDEAYIDDDRAYAVNEITINWNAPFAYLANALEFLQDRIK